MGIIFPTKGTARILGKPVNDVSMHRDIGYLPEQPYFYDYLTASELLDYFARHVGRVFTRDQLLDAVWRDTSYVTPRSVDVYVRRIREKIERDPENPRYLKTVRGAGYRFEVPK